MFFKRYSVVAVLVSAMALGVFAFAGTVQAKQGLGDSCGFCPADSDYCDNGSGGCVGCQLPTRSTDPCDTGLRCGEDKDGLYVCLDATSDIWGEGRDAEELAAQAGFGVEDPRDIIANVINVILGFLGIIAVILILAGGFMWMTAAGNDDKVATSKKLMITGVVGLVIILAAFGISRFVVDALLEATGGVT